ncbi:MAG: hypothetical protein JWP73_851, partial [Phenylobacterium sp.]|nr:hypothetical protein [Phenylobacterium sp.]
MDSDAEMMERHGRLLARFAEQAASLADDLQASALAAETPEQKQALSLAFHRMGRALRQTLALEAKLRRDARREDRLEADRADEISARRVAARKARVRGAVEALIWDEVEDDEQLDTLRLLDERLEYEDLADPDEPVDALIQRVAHELGLPLALPIHGEGGRGKPSPRLTARALHHSLSGEWSPSPEIGGGRGRRRLLAIHRLAHGLAHIHPDPAGDRFLAVHPVAEAEIQPHVFLEALVRIEPDPAAPERAGDRFGLAHQPPPQAAALEIRSHRHVLDQQLAFLVHRLDQP